MRRHALADPGPLPPAAAVEDWQQVIGALDAVRVAKWGPGAERLVPHPSDMGIAKRWLGEGAGVDLLVNVIETVAARQHAAGARPPEMLRYFEKPVAEAIEAARPVQRKRRVEQGLPVSDEEWLVRLETWSENHEDWPRSIWGAPPDDPATEVPVHLLKREGIQHEMR